MRGATVRALLGCKQTRASDPPVTVERKVGECDDNRNFQCARLEDLCDQRTGTGGNSEPEEE